MMLTTINVPTHSDKNGNLCVFEGGKYVPFDICRVFTVCAKVGNIRGDHAHKRCTQLLVCVSGEIRVTCDDGLVVTEHLLDTMATGLLVPPGIWMKEEYMVDDTVLMVLCDRSYEDEDYIRNYLNFKSFLESNRLD